MSVDELLNGPHISAAEFDQLFERLKSWGDYSPATIERGALNHITAETILAAVSLVKSGLVVPTALAWATESGPDNPRPALHYMTSLGEPGGEEPTANTDFIGVDFHGKSTTHIDAMTHIVYKNQLFGGKNTFEMVDSHGSRWSTIDTLGPVVTRGIFLDAARFKEVQWLEPGTAVRASDVLAMEQRYGLTIGAGDCILLRTGHLNRRAKLGAWNPDNFSAGFHFDVMELFKDRKVSIIGSDGDSDVRPPPVMGVSSPIHVLALPGLGIPLLDNMQMEALGEACVKEGRNEFLITIAPLNVVGGTGSPVNPLAIF